MKINPGNARGLLVPQGDRPFSFVVYSSEIRDFGLHVLFGLCSETKAKILIAHELSQCFGQTFGGAVAQKAVFSVSNEGIHTRALLASDGWQTVGHGFGKR